MQGSRTFGSGVAITSSDSGQASNMLVETKLVKPKSFPADKHDLYISGELSCSVED
jgi:hypothetical protein